MSTEDDKRAYEAQVREEMRQNEELGDPLVESGLHYRSFVSGHRGGDRARALENGTVLKQPREVEMIVHPSGRAWTVHGSHAAPHYLLPPLSTTAGDMDMTEPELISKLKDAAERRDRRR